MNGIQAAYNITVHEPHLYLPPKLWTPSRSYVKQFAQILRNMFNYAIEAAVDDTGGTPRSLAQQYLLHRLYAGAAIGVDDYGPVIGASNAPEDVDDNTLGTPFVHGTGAGQMEFGTTTIPALAVVAGQCRLDFTRTFTNSNGYMLTVREVGLIVLCQTWYFLIIRDRPAVDYEVEVGQVLTLTYRIYTNN